MELARVTATVVASRKYVGLEGVKLFLVQPLDAKLREDGEPLVVAAPSTAGIGDVIWWVGGREAALACPETFVPVDAAVVAIADHVTTGGEAVRPESVGRGGRA